MDFIKTIALLIILATTSVVNADEASVALAASAQMDALSSWQDLDTWRKKYAPKYDDGFYAEGISDFVERQFAGHWQSLSELVSLSQASPGLFEFTVAHLGEITGCENTKLIVANSRNSCPKGLEIYCKKIQLNLVPRAAPQCLPKLSK